MDQARPHFGDELDTLKQQLLSMGGLAEERLRTSMRGLVEGDRALLSEVISGDSRIDQLQVDIDRRCFTLLALHQPVAIDLRTVVSALRINTDLERVGDLAVNICEAAQRYLAHPPVKPLIDLPRMGQLALAMLRDALDAFIERDLTLAQGVLRQDAWVDGLKSQIFRELLTFMLGDPRTIEASVDLILISRHIERIGHHATNIAEDVIFIVEARDVRHRSDQAIGTPGPAVLSGVITERRRTFTTPPV